MSAQRLPYVPVYSNKLKRNMQWKNDVGLIRINCFSVNWLDSLNSLALPDCCQVLSTQTIRIGTFSSQENVAFVHWSLKFILFTIQKSICEGHLFFQVTYMNS